MTTKLALKKNPFWIALLLYGFAGVLLFKARLHFIHPDGISYISIAEKYANGNFYEALNKCWAVLISWLIAIPLLFGCAPLWAAKMVTLGIGAFALLAARAFAETFDLPRRFKFLMLLALVPAFLSYAFQRVGPDLLLCGFLLFYLSVFFKKDYLSRPANAVFCGIWGAAAYYAKHYALPFFMVHFFCIHLGFLINSSADERKKIVYRWAAGTGVFLILILPWCGALSLKYGTIATAATGPAVFDWKLGGPHGGGYPYSYPYEDQGFFAPSNATAVSFWEDPTDVKLESWSPLDSKESFRHFLQWIRHNFWLTRKFIRGFSPLSPWIFAVSCAALLSTFFSKRVALLRWRLGGLLFTAALNIAGFLLLKVEDRYFYILPVFLMVLCGLILCEIYKRGSIRRQWVQKLVE
ncbi:MAG TPA: hypothetical protein VJC08_02645, partial [bacterium]|nr:hypothetical protein [bacterium]